MKHRCSPADKPSVGGGIDAETSRPFEAAMSKCKYKISYFRYCWYVSHWSTTCSNAVGNKKFKCPEVIVDTFEPGKKNPIRQIVETVQKVFLALTGLLLPHKSPPPWEEICCKIDEFRWERHAADNVESIIGETTIEFAKFDNGHANYHQFKIFDARTDKLIVDIKHDYTNALVGVSSYGSHIFWERKECLKHKEFCVKDAEIRSVELLDDSDMDVFSKISSFVFKDASDTKKYTCKCFSDLSACDITRFYDNYAMFTAMVRIHTTGGIIDFVAYHMHPLEHKKNPTTTLRLKSTFLSAETEI